MARRRSVVYAVEGKSRRPGFILSGSPGSAATTCTRPSCSAHPSTQRSGREISPGAPAPLPPPLVRDESPQGRARHPQAPGAAGPPRRQHTMISTYVRNRRPATKRGNERAGRCSTRKPPSGRHGRDPQELPYYAGPPIQWPNSTWASVRHADEQPVPSARRAGGIVLGSLVRDSVTALHSGGIRRDGGPSACA